MKEMYGCFICGGIVKENKIVRVYMAGCTNSTDFVHVCKACVKSGEKSLPSSSSAEDEDTPETKEKHKQIADNLLKDIDLSKLDAKKENKNRKIKPT